MQYYIHIAPVIEKVDKMPVSLVGKRGKRQC